MTTPATTKRNPKTPTSWKVVVRQKPDTETIARGFGHVFAAMAMELKAQEDKQAQRHATVEG